ncbi:MAG: hypothetical protein ABH950_06740 [Candidatus Altiarchaeota archaeon]
MSKSVVKDGVRSRLVKGTEIDGGLPELKPAYRYEFLAPVSGDVVWLNGKQFPEMPLTGWIKKPRGLSLGRGIKWLKNSKFGQNLAELSKSFSRFVVPPEAAKQLDESLLAVDSLWFHGRSGYVPMEFRDIFGNDYHDLGFKSVGLMEVERGPHDGATYSATEISGGFDDD